MSLISNSLVSGGGLRIPLVNSKFVQFQSPIPYQIRSQIGAAASDDVTFQFVLDF